MTFSSRSADILVGRHGQLNLQRILISALLKNRICARTGPALPILLVFSLIRWPNQGWQVPNAVVRNMHYLR